MPNAFVGRIGPKSINTFNDLNDDDDDSNLSNESELFCSKYIEMSSTRNIIGIE